MFKRRYEGPLHSLVLSYGGNLSASFAVYFVLAATSRPRQLPPWLAAGLGLVAVEAFELSDGFGVMRNTYDPLDLLANAVGIALGWAADGVLRARATVTQ